MQWYKLRPTFERVVRGEADMVKSRLQAAYEQTRNPNRFGMYGEYGELHLPVAEHRLWSPHLSFYVCEHEGVCLIRGRFAPRQDVWTFVWVVYLFMAFSAFFGLSLGYTQWRLGESLWGVGVAVVATLVISGLYVVAHVGQQWSVDQMHALLDEFEQLMATSGIELEWQSRGEPSLTS